MEGPGTKNWTGRTTIPPPAPGVITPQTMTLSLLKDTPLASVIIPNPMQDHVTVLPGTIELAKGATVIVPDKVSISLQWDPASVIWFAPVSQNTPASATSSGLLSSSVISATTPRSTEGVRTATDPTSPVSVSTTLGGSTAAIAPSSGTRPNSNKDKSSLSAGAAAGVGIGCLVAGALVAGLVFWLCCGKRRKTHTGDSETRTLELAPYSKKPLTGIIPLDSGISSANTFDAGIAQPLEDKILTGEISKISNSIKNHVQSYYHSGRVNSALVDDDDLRVLGSDMPVSVQTLSGLLASSTNREIALRFCMAWAIVTRIQGQPSGFLPTELTQCLQSTSVAHGDMKAHNALLAKWRVMTAALLQPTYVRNAFTSSDSRNNSIRATVGALDNVLQPYADSRMDNEQRRRNLEEIVKRAAVFAFTLFSQPSSWHFDWSQAQSPESGELCIFPALLQVTDETGNMIRPPRPFSESVMRRMDT